MGAGILPITINPDNNNIYFLLSREQINSDTDPGLWSDFGGTREKGETKLDTAIREGWEESNGFLGTKKILNI